MANLPKHFKTWVGLLDKRLAVDVDPEYVGQGLRCPQCAEFNLHHYKVEVFERGEDDPIVDRVTIGTRNGAFSLEHSKDKGLKNPSMRRHGLTISFWCEHCDLRPILGISQNKGTTNFDWVGSELVRSLCEEADGIDPGGWEEDGGSG